MLSNERKALVGSTEPFDVLIPGVVSGLPALSFRRDGTEVAGAGFALKRAAETCTAINGNTLTGTFAAGAGYQGSVYGRAYLVTAQNGIFPVQVDELTTTAARLTEPLPQDVVITGALTASLVWPWWSAPIPAAVTATETGEAAVDWWVTYTESRGSGPGTLANQRVSGVLHVVAGKFATGLSDEALSHLYGHIVPRARVGSLSHAGPIEATRLRLFAHLRSRLNSTESGRREDDLNGAEFLGPHAMLAASEVLRLRNPEQADRLETSAYVEADKVLASVSWYDPEGDGKGTTGAPAQKSRVLVGGFSGPARSTTAANPFGYRTGGSRV